MEFIALRCPICKEILPDPDKLREHRLKEHKSVTDIISVTI